ncbi:phosphocholine cytidylyltransferase family protein [Sinomicrobium oceani]|uniref:phosphocholine cytidylyltransferase family protein n=1 Tax=Sinomicrobium oceani TaxID=1150368 RepID=UPI00227CB3B7|nr:NTP transferase domain-containing protein [Sinomicrobium oceani]
MVAIILAAGCGKRLQINKPKGMLNIGCQPLIKYSIDSLESCGITKIIIVTGFAADSYERYLITINTKADIKLVHNESFNTSGSLYSLDLALSYIENQNLSDDLVIMDSDIIYNRDEFMDFIAKNNDRNAIMASNVIEGRYDACYLEIGTDDSLLKISKNVNYISKNEGFYWEHIGIVKSSEQSIKELITYSKKMFRSNNSLHHEYDYVFENLSRKYKIIKYPDYIWSEVDDNTQLHYLITNIYPKLNLPY